MPRNLLYLGLVCIFLAVNVLLVRVSLADPGRYWHRMDTDIESYFQELPGNSQVVYNVSRGSHALWAINFTVSGFGYCPTTLLVCDADGFQH